MHTILNLITLFWALASIQVANAACIPHGVAESIVSGRTYILENSPNPIHPVRLIFGDTIQKRVFYGSPLDGQPSGEYHFRGNCHGEIIITFTSYFDPNHRAQEVLHLRPKGSEYFFLQSGYDRLETYKIVVD
ncbi:MAG: hypothetical protein KDD61_08210 [Bdellovibrionales bacterium]|nr:hypothetical protein [Bdellovibrionales bacterium]